jgi:hypothetical protein
VTIQAQIAQDINSLLNAIPRAKQSTGSGTLSADEVLEHVIENSERT